MPVTAHNTHAILLFIYVSAYVSERDKDGLSVHELQKGEV